MRRFGRVFTLVLVAGMAAWTPPAAGQQSPNLRKIGDELAVREADQAFWTAFNRCDQTGMAERLTTDIEFYHDKTGFTESRRAVTASISTGPCANPASLRVRREAIINTDHFHPLAGGFALLEGKHRFLATRSTGAERHDSVARYLEVWKRDADGNWRTRRVVSFDHRPDEPVLTGTPLSSGEAMRYLGDYAADDGSTMVVVNDGGLILRSGKATFPLVRLAAGRFGTPGRWLEFRFVGDNLTVVEEGQAVARGRRVAALPP